MKISSSFTMEDGEGAFAELRSSSLLSVSGVVPLPALLLLLELAVVVDKWRSVVCVCKEWMRGW